MKKKKNYLIAFLALLLVSANGFGQGLYSKPPEKESPAPTQSVTATPSTESGTTLYGPSGGGKPGGGGENDTLPVSDAWFVIGGLAFVYGLAKIRKREGRA